jgi:hypothetical protein
MTADPDPQAARAARLREQIEELTKNKPEKGDKDASGATPEAKERESPREFIHRRMCELDKKAGD